VHDRKSVIGIICPCHLLRYAPTSTCKAEEKVKNLVLVDFTVCLLFCVHIFGKQTF